MAVHYRTQGFVLTKNDLREADQVFDILTKDFGKIKILGRAIRKISSKLRSGINLFYLSEIEFIQGKNYKTLTDALILNKFDNIRKNLDGLEVLQRISETASFLIKGEEADDKIWNLFVEIFDELSREGTKDCKPAYYYFFWNILSILGYQIDLYHCARCREKLIPGIMNFSAEQNGIICLRCSFDDIKDKIKISSETVKVLRFIQKNDLSFFKKLKIEKEFLAELGLVTENYSEVLAQEF